MIILYDNDDGTKTIKKTIKDVSKVIFSGTELFVHLIKNLYAVPTPFGAGGAASRIEDLFDA